MVTRKLGIGLVLFAVATVGLGGSAPAAVASTPVDGYLLKAPSLVVTTDGGVGAQTLDLGADQWWTDFQEAYAKRLDQGIGWPSDFVAKFESFRATGSWGVVISPDGVISLFGTADPDAHCDLTAPTTVRPAGMFGCYAHPGFAFATAEYFAHNSYGGNGCRPDICSFDGMGIYESPTVGVVASENDPFWLRFPSRTLGVYELDFDINYPAGYEGQEVGTKPQKCPAVQMIGVAGSGENGGEGTGRDHVASLGAPVGAFDRELGENVKAKFGATSYGAPIKIDYPAVAVGWEWDLLKGLLVLRDDFSAAMHSGTYQDSVHAGAAALSQVLARELGCANTKLVLAGYSQGAQVIGDVLANWQSNFPGKSKSAVAGVVLFGDPQFNAQARGVTKKSTFSPDGGGVLGGRDRDALRGFDSATKHVFSYCRELDPICQNVLHASVFDPSPHMEYDEFESFWAANNVATDLEAAGGLGAPRQMDASLSARLDASGSNVVFRCVLRDAGTFDLVSDSGATCQVQGTATLSASGGQSQSFTSDSPVAGRAVGSPFSQGRININDLLNTLPACSGPIAACNKRKVRLVASLRVVGSADGYEDVRLRAHRFPLAG